MSAPEQTNPTHIGLPEKNAHFKVLKESTSGYVAPVFAGKEQQMEQVMDLLETKEFIPTDFIETETNWFYTSLGIDDVYFESEKPETIANHILSLYAAKVAAFSRDDKKLEIRLDRESEDGAVYIDTSTPGVSNLNGAQYEQRIDEKYLAASSPQSAFRVETFRSASSLGKAAGVGQQLRCYFVYKCKFVNPEPAEGETDLSVVSDVTFLNKVTENTKAIYQGIVSAVMERTGPVIEMYEVEGTREKRVVIGYKQGSAAGFFSALSDLYHYYGLTSARKYVEQFSNGVTVMSIYLRPLQAPSAQKYPPIEASVHQVVKEISLLYCIPQNKFHTHFVKGQLSLQETIYAHCVSIFIGHVINRLGAEYYKLKDLIDVNDPVGSAALDNLRKRLRDETFTQEYIFQIINNHPDLVHALYLAFADKHYVMNQEDKAEFIPTLSFQRLQIDKLMDADELQVFIRKQTGSSENAPNHQERVMNYFLHFNESVMKTNFYTPTKVALSYRLKPSAKLFSEKEYETPLYGMFLVVGSEFRGFHLRFRDVARGGIRIVKSRSVEAWAENARNMFEENYNLAHTQQRKNKDIPEGGSKGVILLDADQQEKREIAFEKYIDSLLDLLLPATSPGIKDPIVDLLKEPEILFMGPDENTADLVGWATLHAKKRGAPWWKSFFTGKSQKFGGIPHDEYGMTSLSVRQYVEGIYRRKGLNPSELRKMQTGGPDGDLGSNEILLSNEKYIAIVDGSGVLCDPNGIDRDELISLAKRRKMINHFNKEKLSPEGYIVLVDDKDVTLPTGEVVDNGTSFRNTYHLRPQGIDVFVPCGGRPNAINLGNYRSLLDADGKSIIPNFVEGANLFISKDAKLELEKAGATLFKDASANKGGVTSSSMEVLASLAFDDEGFQENMCLHGDKRPAFYDAYVKTVQEKIKENARLEFEAMWREHELTGKPYSLLSDEISLAIVKMDEELQASDLWNNQALRRAVLNEALPNLLIEKIGLDTLLGRIPEKYLRSIFGSYLASRFVYEHGSTPSAVTFYDL
ncbi:NAD-specific glutamate dehydrogenase [Ascobolus immersus RN42]|uniref:NAD-specific glutamate dehydrogenase n=1 Tax=Ascobolus immersus RN42 TaxID=1160509 RepID=A0A3N4IP27_ASCIM|nr:NAD-specific glutamate dehydrogenase [Ascobolus immersus RN42]